MSGPARRQYDRAAPRYDRRWAGYVRRTLDVLDARAAVRPDERVLDVGCGTGAFAARLVARHPMQHVVGVDVSEGMLAEARRKLGHAPGAAFVRAAADALPFDAAAFDIVVSASALHYFPDPARALAEMHRVLRPGGRVVVLDWSRDFWWMALLDGALRLFDPAHGRTLSAGEVRALLVKAGFAAPAVERVRRSTWGLMVARARKASPED